VKQYLRKYGHRILDNGYEVIPITPGKKAPMGVDYSSKALPKITHKRVNRWLSNGHARDGVGIRTRFTPMFDIDSTWEPQVEACIKDAEDVIGFAPARIGNAPKTGLIFRSIRTFKKVQSKAFTDPNGNKAAVEFLGDGQQFVAHAIHPDTKRPYRWPDKGMNPINMPHDELAVVTEEQALEVVQRFETRCIEWEWPRWKSKSQSTALTTRAARDPDDIGGTTPLGISIDEIREWMARLGNDEDVEYEDNYNLNPEKPNYRNVIFAIWHETDGSEAGREIALAWSEKSSKHEEEIGRFEKLWNSADHEDRDDAVTFRYVIKCVLVQEEIERKEQRDELLSSLQGCTDVDDLKEIVGQIKRIRFEGFDYEKLAQELKRAWNRITGFTLSIERARKEITHVPTEEDLPPWVKQYVYIQHSKRLYSRTTGLELDRESFDATYSRYLNGASAYDYAINKAQIKTFYMTMYKPDDEESFWFMGMECINTYSDRLVPEMPGRYRKSDLAAISIVEEHIEYILPDERERRLFISYLAHIVQTRQRPNWMVVLQGVQGDGKSFFGEMMAAVLGGNNVRMLDAQQLEDRYTGWTVGQLLTVVEELRLQGHSRYDIMNKIKPFITNEAINVHPKNVNPYTALNTTAYIAFTNYKDALAIDDNDRRYTVFYSRWQMADELRKFLQDNPDYFERLFGTIKGPKARAGALRQWLMGYELHPEFNPLGRAPMTAAREEMIALNKSDAQTAFEEVLEANDQPRISRDIVISGALTQYLYDHSEETLSTRAVSVFLTNNGYSKLPFRHRVQSEGDTIESIWVRDKKGLIFKTAAEQRQAVMKLLRVRQRQISHEKEI
jgi:hypothetical protein